MKKNMRKRWMAFISVVMVMLLTSQNVAYAFEKHPNWNTGLTPVETIDSTSKGVELKMVDYNEAAFNGAEWISKNRDIKQGILSKTLNADGYPSFNPYNQWNTPTEGSLKQHYENARPVNHLFLKSVYEQQGKYFYYSSAEHAASLNQNGNFNVYKELVTPSEDDGADWKRGNFLPYNTFQQKKVSRKHKNTYDLDGNFLSKRYGETLYLPDQDPNYYFGLEMRSNFIQSENGIYDGNPMVYEFTGDDDLWVYIDGVLVLDLGGEHDARSGSIDFSTGIVKYQTEKNVNKETSLYELFKRAGKESAVEWENITLPNGVTTKIFKNYSGHELKMWYMERGAGASNLRVKFNLPVIPKEQIQVKKELAQTTDPVVYGNVDFGFELYLETEAGSNQYQMVTDTKNFDAKKIGSDGFTETDLTINEKGRFYLKPNETAKFNNVDANRKYYVKEVDIHSDEFDQVYVNNVSVTDKYEDGSENVSYEAKSTEEMVSQRPLVIFKNSCNAKNLRTLSMKKTMNDNQNTSETFQLKVELENENGNLSPFKGMYHLFENEEASQGQQLSTDNGIISIKSGQKAMIYNILSDTKFKVTEMQPNGNFGEVRYQLNGSNFEPSLSGVEGTIELGNDAEVVVENRFDTVGSLTFKKVNEKQEGLANAIFGLYTDETCENELAEEVSQEDGTVSFDLSDTKYKNYQRLYLKEKESPFQYVLNETVYTVELSQGNHNGTTAISAIIKDKGNKITEIENILLAAGGKSEVTAIKSWAAGIKEEYKVPVRVTLYSDDKPTNESVILDKENQWTHTWKDLPGNHKYTVVEEAIDGFQPEYSTSSEITTDSNFKGITSNNQTRFNLEGNGVIAIYSGAKWFVWTTSELTTSQEAEMIKALNNSSLGGKEISRDNAKFGHGNTSYSFKGDPITFVYDKNTGILDLSFPKTNAWSWFGMGNYTDHITVQIKNDIDENKITSIPIEKIWDDENASNRPTSVEVSLLKKVNGTFVETGQILVLNEKTNWKGVFEDLPYWDKDTKLPVEYSVKETKIGDVPVEESTYQSTVEKNENGFVITNKLMRGSLLINKEIVNHEDMNPAHGDAIFTFRITNKDESIILYRTLRLTKENFKGSIEVTNLPLGEYKIEELDTIRYISIDGKEKSASIKNTNEPEAVTFKNKLVVEDNFSHTDMIENEFHISQDGTVVISPNKKENQEERISTRIMQWFDQILLRRVVR